MRKDLLKTTCGHFFYMGNFQSHGAYPEIILIFVDFEPALGVAHG